MFLLQGGVSTVALDTAVTISSFGEDEDGEVYLVGLAGTIFRIENSCEVAPHDPTCPVLGLAASVNAPVFTAGQTMTFTVGVTDPGLPGAADFYVGVLMPDGNVVLFTPGDTTIVVSVENLASFRARAENVALATPFAASRS